MRSPVSFFFQPHVWHSRQRALKAVDQRGWHSTAWLLLSLMECICISQRKTFNQGFCFQQNAFHIQTPTRQHQSQPQSNVTRVNNLRTVTVYGFIGSINVMGKDGRVAFCLHRTEEFDPQQPAGSLKVISVSATWISPACNVLCMSKACRVKLYIMDEGEEQDH